MVVECVDPLMIPEMPRVVCGKKDVRFMLNLRGLPKKSRRFPA